MDTGTATDAEQIATRMTRTTKQWWVAVECAMCLSLGIRKKGERERFK